MPTDELAEIDGIKPKVWLNDGEDKEVGSQTSKSVYKCKRTLDHYYCTCPAWRNQSRVPVNARSCKHLKSLLGDDYEEARIRLKNPDAPPPKAKPASRAKKPASTSKSSASNAKAAQKPAASKRKRGAADEDDEDEAAAEDKHPVKKRTRGKPESAVSNASAKGTAKAAPPKEADDVKMDDIQEEGKGGDVGDAPEDELASINGVTPKILMADGEEKEVSSLTSNSKYKVKRTWDHYYCSCPAWRNQGGMPVNARTCKHLKELLGEKYELARLKYKNPDGPDPSSNRKPASKAKAKAAKGKQRANADGDGAEDDDDEGEDADGAAGGAKAIPELLLAAKWDLETGPDPTGWWISEKLDGVRAFYDGTRMISRLGNPFTPPKWFMEALPTDVTLDGELFGGRGEFQSTVSVVKTINSPHWQGISFQVFDVPSKADMPFEDRLAFLEATFGEKGTHAAKHVVVVPHDEARDRAHVLDKLKEIEGLGGEGLMLRKPRSPYEGRRSNTLLKIKTFYDAEAIVTGYEPGKGRNKGVTGALKCKMASGKTFSVGTGLSDKQRRDPPKIGAIITYRFFELTRDGVPRFPSYVGEAVDKDEPKDAEISKGGKREADKDADE
ncbi:SWIM-type domain-containing protein [Pleurotus pulmonarius]